MAAEPDRDEDEQELAKGLVRHSVQRALLVLELAALAEGDLERQESDDRVDQATGDEARARKPFEPAGSRDSLACRSSNTDSAAAGGIAHCPSSPSIRGPAACIGKLASGTRTVMPLGSTFALRRFTVARSPPSSSYRTFRLSSTSTF